MTRDECSRARRVASKLVALLSPRSEEQALAIKLHGMLIPPPTPADVMGMVLPAESIAARSRLLGISRQQYYQLQKGLARPRLETVQRIAEATGISAETLRGVW